MTSDLDIYRTTSVLIREHGDEADLVTAMRADEFLEKGDMEGSAVWRSVLNVSYPLFTRVERGFTIEMLLVVELADYLSGEYRRCRVVRASPVV